ncbi:MAG: rod shape-determining protein MreD [Actinomycetota bacterium]|nr:rod shape-determining protein MreD [Actinomycetota bacterium]
MILTPKIWARLAALVLATALLQVVFFSKIELFGSSPDGAVLVVMTLGLLGGSLSGAVGGFSVGLLIDCLLMQTLGAFAAALMAVGYVSGRYRESAGRATSGVVPVIGGAITLLGAIAFAAVQIGTGVDADVSAIVVRDALVKTLLGAALSLPVFLLVRLVLRPALVEDRPDGKRRSAAPAPAAGTR